MTAIADAAIRPAEASDLSALAGIYDHYIVHSTITFDLEPLGTEGRRAWFEGSGDGLYPGAMGAEAGVSTSEGACGDKIGGADLVEGEERVRGG